MAASIIRDEIRMKVYDTSEYPDMCDTEAIETAIPGTLLRLLNGIIKSKSKLENSTKRRCQAIAHSIISACRPRSFISPLLLSIAVYIHRRYGSRELIDILNSLSFSDDYHEIQRLNTALMQSGVTDYDLGNCTQFIFDNADFNVNTLTGHDTFHAMGGLACVTPPCDKPKPIIKRSAEVQPLELSGMFGNIDLCQYEKPSETLPSIFKPLSLMKQEQAYLIKGLNVSKTLNQLWLSSFSLSLQPAQCPFWSGFMQVVHGHSSTQQYDKCKKVILPFINHDPNNLSTIYTALSFAQKLIDKYNLGVCAVTFDQPLYAKSREIVQNTPDLSSLFIRLGGFHQLMSYMGSVGYIMTNSGLDGMWEQVYAPNTVAHMLTGHAYARSLRAHLISAAAVISLLLDQPGSMEGVNIDNLRQIHQDLLSGEKTCHDIPEDVLELANAINKVSDEVKNASRTGKLWLNYVEYVTIMQLFIHAERSGNWDLHLYCTRQMIPLFHAAGHLAYAKYARLYVQDMESLSERMSNEQFHRFTTMGYFSIRKSNTSWAGNFSDQTIEQELMRLLKSSGGMTHGRGITDSTLSKWVLTLPYHIPVCDSLESFTGVHCSSSEQHKDLRMSSRTRDFKDHSIFLQWLTTHSPFQYTNYDSLVSISTGLVSDSNVNCDEAYNVGLSSACRLDGKEMADVKISRKDKVLTMEGSSNTVTVRGQDAVVNPTLLLMRITCVMKDEEEMKTNLCYELAQQPPALFDKGYMRKTNKSILAAHLKSKVTKYSEIPPDPWYVVDGGHLLHTVVWPKDATYQQVCQAYIDYVIRHYGHKSVICFDGYDKLSTKDSEQQRRAKQMKSAVIAFERSMKVTTAQRVFLQNRKNKSRLIKFITDDMNAAGITVKQATGDADQLIVSTALSLADQQESPVIVIATDTDILSSLVDLANPQGNIFMLDSNKPIKYVKIQDVQKEHSDIAGYIMILHSITGSDTTSALFMKGKLKAIDVFEKDKDYNILDPFQTPGSTHEDIQASGEAFLLKLYGGEKAASLDSLRYIMYKRLVSKTRLTSGFKLETLPPTSAAAKFHSFRAYHTVQQWLGNDLSPLLWGWKLSNSGQLVPVETDKPVAPDSLLRMISCGCKTGCGRSCGCRKNGLSCSVMCSNCYGLTCSNIKVDICE